jgi:hypothetical protein
MIALIAAVGSMYIGNMNSNAFARSSHHNHDHGDNDRNDRHVCIGHKHISIGHRHVCINDRHVSSDDHQGEIILSSPGLPQQQLSISSSSQLPQTTTIPAQPTQSTIIPGKNKSR